MNPRAGKLPETGFSHQSLRRATITKIFAVGRINWREYVPLPFCAPSLADHPALCGLGFAARRPDRRDTGRERVGRGIFGLTSVCQVVSSGCKFPMSRCASSVRFVCGAARERSSVLADAHTKTPVMSFVKDKGSVPPRIVHCVQHKGFARLFVLRCNFGAGPDQVDSDWSSCVRVGGQHQRDRSRARSPTML